MLESVLVRTVQARRWRRHRVRGGRYPPPSSVLGPSLSLYCPDSPRYTRKLPRRDSVHIPLRALHSEENISSSKCSVNQLRNNHYELSNTTLDNHQNCKIDSFLHPITKVARCLLLSEWMNECFIPNLLSWLLSIIRRCRGPMRRDTSTFWDCYCMERGVWEGWGWIIVEQPRTQYNKVC